MNIGTCEGDRNHRHSAPIWWVRVTPPLRLGYMPGPNEFYYCDGAIRRDEEQGWIVVILNA